jgi:Cd2+/Zn2+-exporting ATPase
MGRTHASIRALLDMAPKEAELYRDGVLVRVPVDELRVGDVVLVRPGSLVPADGMVIKGESAVNEASITGEAMPVEKRQGLRVFAGTFNGQGALDVRVTTAVGDSTLARIVAIVREAREQKAQSQDFTDRVIGQYYAYAVVGITLLAIAVPLLFFGWDLGKTLYRAMTLMVVASPCALVISVPAALLSALASAARSGVLFKGGRYLEVAARVSVVAFDKTGTLTTGRPGVVAIIPVGGHAKDDAGISVTHPRSYAKPHEEGSLPRELVASLADQNEHSRIGDWRSRDQHPLFSISPVLPVTVTSPADDKLGPMTDLQIRLLEAAAAIEQFSEHPLARAIVKAAQERGIAIAEADEFEAQTGAGAIATVGGLQLRIGRPALFEHLTPDVAIEIAAQESMGHTVVALGDEEPWGLIAIADTVRPEAEAAVRRLKQIGIKRVVLLTGDNAPVATALGSALGVDEVRSELLPHEKVAAIKELQERYGPVAMVGDGVNDAPALATAALGVAMGVAGTDVALESADVLLMGDDLARFPGALAHARRARTIIRQNLTFAFGVMAILMLFTIFGNLALPLGVVGHEGSTLVVVANGLRLLVRRW